MAVRADLGSEGDRWLSLAVDPRVKRPIGPLLGVLARKQTRQAEERCVVSSGRLRIERFRDTDDSPFATQSAAAYRNDNRAGPTSTRLYWPLLRQLYSVARLCVTKSDRA